MARMTVEGLQELIDNVNKLGVEGKKIKEKALKQSAEKVKNTMKDKAPKSDFDKEHMADNINISDIKSEDGVDYIEIGPNKGDNSEFFYSKFTEWGTSKIPAQHWAENSLLENEKDIKNIIIQELQKGLEGIGE